ncbi:MULTISPECIES: glyceraldehyde-3-phosphate dehydrogenase [unclassified Rhodococcus (in: high G+C Gram-positive bacteria)]|uniref:glyceraldehyde-3-phosphate dehydrogenase n=1 Tax=unclassified Rhodococcus (in: high G+C Gram-positive bacteria) TaxID=192944 RepID=UPI00163ACF01|nr:MULTISPECIES: glyceraldehyde-3-phosphate dehydrogenase [unclassified Rhodococcus (in: high G+C Gram-positive bacteria)]MBC2640749.1 glyceraldehyde-3-phosphate dehydrogenase [Rhodococcus sp. 3A]MBC2894506.1 glyceraldehyde-3-phosphate dehydrogenase [Rhodococcus sp. 4CII]
MTSEELTRWNSQEAIAEAMIPIIGTLYRAKGVTILLHSRSLVNKSVISILRTHRFSRQIGGDELSVDETFPFLEALCQLDLGASKIDLGLLVMAYREQGNNRPIAEFVADTLSEITGERKSEPAGPRDVVLYGFGRIGRLVARLLIEKAGSGGGLNLRAVVVRKSGAGDLSKRASLLRRDSVHGQFNGTIKIDEQNNTLTANGNVIKFIYSDDPTCIDYTEHGITNAILVDNTGKWRDRDGLEQHLRPGIDKVVLTAPGKGEVPNIVHGVNHRTQNLQERIFSCASCTTNAIVPPLQAMDDEFGIVRGHVETVHSFTNDQNLLDNFHGADRRGRSAPFNLVLTETGAASAVAKALPSLQAKITGNSIRVPTPDVSMAILNLQLRRETTKEDVVEHLRRASLTGPLSRNLDFTAATDAVSSDFIGSRAACIVDANAAIIEGDSAIIYVWYDNEFGYSCQVVRTVQFLSGIEYPTYPTV